MSTTNQTPVGREREGRQQDDEDQDVASDAKLEWFNDVLECDERICNNCFGRRVEPGQSVEDAYQHARSAGRNAMGGGKQASQTASIYCNDCGAGYGLNDLVDLDVVAPRVEDHSDNDHVPRQAWEDPDDRETPVHRTTGHARLVKQAASHGAPSDLRVERAENEFEIVAVDEAADADVESEAAWEWPTNLTQRAAREALGSVGREWSEQEPMPKRGSTPSLFRVLCNAADRLDEKGFNVNREKAKIHAELMKDEAPSQDRAILAGALFGASDVSVSSGV